MKTVTLQNGRTKVPAKSDVYKNKDKFHKSLLTLIDTAVVYEEFNKQYNILQRLDNHIETSFYGCYRFYPDGRLNYFVLNRNKPSDLNDFNPEYRGYRGVYYSENDKIRFDLFAEIDDMQNIGKITGTLIIKGDTLYVMRDVDKRYIDIYIKRELPPGYLDYKANW